jgi:hypothetical protein
VTHFFIIALLAAMLLANRYLNAPIYHYAASAIFVTTAILFAIPDIIGLFIQDDWILHVGWWGMKYEELMNTKLHNKYIWLSIIVFLLILSLLIYDYGTHSNPYKFALMCCFALLWASFHISAFYHGAYVFARRIIDEPSKPQGSDLKVIKKILFEGKHQKNYFALFYLFLFFLINASRYNLIFVDDSDVSSLFNVILIIVFLAMFFFAFQQKNYLRLILKSCLSRIESNSSGIPTERAITKDDVDHLYFDRCWSVLLSAIIFFSCLHYVPLIIGNL